MQIVHFILTGVLSLALTTSPAQPADTTQENSASIKLRLPAAQNNALENAATQSEEEDRELEGQIKEQQKIEVENALIRARLERELADLRAEIERLRLQKEASILQWEVAQEQQYREHAQAMFELNQQKEKLMAEVDLSQAKLAQMTEQFKLASTTLQNKVTLLKTEIDQLHAEIDQAKARKERAKLADRPISYLDEPLQNTGTLVVSDRYVALNGLITPWKANYIVDQIRYLNNKDSKKPIFIIIGSSPGGSALAGARILKAMENSHAPVHVVVEEFAASMAALITTLAKKSYAYPNAIILHHQPWTSAWGNVREIKELYEEIRAWWRRLGGLVAKKMGISLDKLDKQLYEKSARGAWMEFADNAHKLKWIDHIITGIDDSAIREMPEAINYTFEHWVRAWYGMGVASDHATAAITYLPPLGPKDFYYLYNLDNRYQVRSAQ